MFAGRGTASATLICAGHSWRMLEGSEPCFLWIHGSQGHFDRQKKLCVTSRFPAWRSALRLTSQLGIFVIFCNVQVSVGKGSPTEPQAAKARIIADHCRSISRQSPKAQIPRLVHTMNHQPFDSPWLGFWASPDKPGQASHHDGNIRQPWPCAFTFRIFQIFQLSIFFGRVLCLRRKAQWSLWLHHGASWCGKLLQGLD